MSPLVAALDEFPKDLQDCKVEDLKKLNDVVFDFEGDSDEAREDALRLFKIVDKLANNWVRSVREEKPRPKRRSKPKKESTENEDGEEEEAEKDEEKEEQQEEEEQKPVDRVKYHKSLIALVGTVQGVEAFSPTLSKKTRQNLKLLCTAPKELKEPKKDDKTPSGVMAMTPELVLAIKTIQSLKLDGKLADGSAAAKKKGSSRNRNRNRNRRDREGEDKGEQGESKSENPEVVKDDE